MELAAREDLGEHGAARRHGAHHEPEQRQREQPDAAVLPVEARAARDLEEGGEVAQRVVARHGEQRQQPHRRVHPEVEQEQGEDPAEEQHRAHRVDAQQQQPVELLPEVHVLRQHELVGVAQRRVCVAARPAADLADAYGPRLGTLLVALGAVDVRHAPAVRHEVAGDVGVLGERRRAPAADGLQRRAPQAAAGAAVLGHEAEVHARLLVDLVAARPLQVLKAREEVRAGVDRDHTAHHGAHEGVGERRHEPLDHIAAREIVGVEVEDDLGVGQRHGVVERRRFAGVAVYAVEGADARRVARFVGLDDGPRAVRRAVVDRHDDEAVGGVVHAEQRFERARDDRLLVVARHPDGDRRPVHLVDRRERVLLPAEQAVEREDVVSERVREDERDHRPQEEDEDLHPPRLVTLRPARRGGDGGPRPLEIGGRGLDCLAHGRADIDGGRARCTAEKGAHEDEASDPDERGDASRGGVGWPAWWGGHRGRRSR